MKFRWAAELWEPRSSAIGWLREPRAVIGPWSRHGDVKLAFLHLPALVGERGCKV